MTTQTLNILSRAGYDEVASAFGERKAIEARIAYISQRIAETRNTLWHSRRWEKLLINALADEQVFNLLGYGPYFLDDNYGI